MYLTIIRLNHTPRIKELTHLGAYHNWVEQAFPGEIKGNIRKRHLWRFDHGTLYIVSQNRPNAYALGKYGDKRTLKVIPYDNVLHKAVKGAKLNFKIRAFAATPRWWGKNGQKHRSFDLIEDKNGQLNWLKEKGKEYGFEVVTVYKQYATTRRLYHTYNRQGTPLAGVEFTGRLIVTDPVKFKKALTEGIGREKAYGMGLLLVR